MTRDPGFVARFADECPRCHREIIAGRSRVVLDRFRRLIHVECHSGQDDE